MKVLHVLGARGMGWSGGISATLRSLADSPVGRDSSFREATLTEAAAILREWRPDLFVWHGACSWGVLPRLAALRRRCRGVVIEHHYSAGFERCQVRARRRFRTLLRLSYGLMNRVVAVSEGQARWMRQERLAPQERLRVLRSSRRVEPFLAVPERAPGTGPLHLVAYGRLTEQKGIDVLIRAVRDLPRGSVRLSIGGEGPQEGDLRALAAADPAIAFLGRVDDVPALLATADAVVIPSRWEPWGNVCLEARAAGRPVIASDVDGLSEQIAGCGLPVSAGDSPALTAAIRRLLELPAPERQALGEAGRASARGAWQAYLEGWESLLGEFR
jgi:glycosyltransferase involved in cell wall biosynthesis